MTYLLN